MANDPTRASHTHSEWRDTTPHLAEPPLTPAERLVAGGDTCGTRLMLAAVGMLSAWFLLCIADALLH